MKTRYKILIIICLSFIPISIVFPQVFLIFHLDKYETNKICDTLNGKWDWYSNKCVDMKYENHDIMKMCIDFGGSKSCDSRCSDSWGWNYWEIVFPRVCHLICSHACEFIQEPEEWYASDQYIGIIEYCYEKSLGKDMDLILTEYHNDTHWIDNNICEWQKNYEKFPWEKDVVTMKLSLDHYLNNSICSTPMIIYILEYSNVFDSEFDGSIVSLKWPSLPDGVSKDEFDECLDYILEERLKEIEPRKLEQQATLQSVQIIHEDDLVEIVFGNRDKQKEVGWRIYAGAGGLTLPINSTLTPIYKEYKIIRSLDFKAMLDDKIFVDKCESNGGLWNYTYHDCELPNFLNCEDIGGIHFAMNISTCTSDICLDRAIYRQSCVFVYNGE